MGYLDEAIRDHLALQRQRGVPAGELERAEAEALGPVGAADLAESVSERTVEDAEDVVEPELTPDEGPRVSSNAPTQSEHDLTPDEGPRASSNAPTQSEHDQTTQAFSLDEFDEAEAVQDGTQQDSDDPLEATPDFLQETPEHDRLWFEQKPPKDFDF